MTASIITIAQQKGGAGKTTLAAHLGVCWAEQGRRVSLLDIDPQASLSSWFNLRKNEKPTIDIECRAFAGWRTALEIDKLRATRDLIVIDSPPHAATEARIAIRAADLMVMPVQLSPMDLWATRPTLEIARNEKTPILMVLNRVAARGMAQDRIRDQIMNSGLPVAQATLGGRVAFSASLMEGQGVTESDPHSLAATEVMALCKEIDARLQMPL